MFLPVSENTIVDVIRFWVEQRPNQEVLRFYPQGEGEYAALSFAQLDLRCQAIASQLQAYRGQRALLLFNSSLEFLEGLFACFYAGVVAVPAYPPRKNHHLKRLSALIDDCQPQLVLSSQQISERAKPLFEEANDNILHDLFWLDTENIDTLRHADYQLFTPEENQLAFLQYTSGSTGKPKGVMISHKNIMANVCMAQQSFALPETARCISWLPLFHDMGLIGSVLAPLYWGAGSVIMPPAAFLQKPLRFLKLLHEFGKLSPVGCTAPNFCYQLCVDNVSDEELQSLDLSNWIFALSGAEPIRLATLDAFIKKFAPCGFDKKALVPAYGMAECTVLSSCKQGGEIISLPINAKALAANQLIEDQASPQVLVSSGQSCAPQTLKIVQPETRQILADGQVGEIWLAGPHIGQGYWNKPEQTKALFHAYTEDGQGPYLRTGDLAALINGQLFVTGRQKDLLIIRGQNHYPQDIELTAMSAFPGLNHDQVAAFTIEHGQQEKLVIVQEVERSAQKNFAVDVAAKAISQAIAKAHGIECWAIVFIRFASIAKTSSGKIQRHACKKAFQDQTLNLIGQWQAETQKQALPKKVDIALADISQAALAAWIANWLSAKTGIDVGQIAQDSELDSLGLDSVDLLQLSGELESWLGKPIEPSLIYQQADINALAQTLINLAKEQSASVDDGEIEGVI